MSSKNKMKKQKTLKQKFDITIYNIAASIELTIALLADLHNRPFEEILNILSAQKPDVIAIAGDLVDKKENDTDDISVHSPNSLELLRACTAIAPTYYALGNHEWILEDLDIELIKKTGVKLLDNSYAILKENALIGGLTSATTTCNQIFRTEHDDWDWHDRHERASTECKKYRELSRVPDTDWLAKFEKQNGYKILLCHHPEYWAVQQPFLSQRAIDLVCAGHGHGGQIRFGNQGIFAPGQGFFPRYTAGVHRSGNHTLVISRGLANTASIPRINNRPEIVFIRLGNYSRV